MLASSVTEVTLAATVCIAYISPNGSTTKVAETIADQVADCGAEAALTDLSNGEETQSLIRKMSSDEETLLFVGSPVYMNMAVPPVMAFIDKLPHSPGRWAVPFVTYGMACSGIALWQMADALQGKGFRIAGAAKVAALHSMMWSSDHPEGEGCPTADDLSHVRTLVETIQSRLNSSALVPLNLSALDYHPPELAAKSKEQLTQPRKGIPRTVDEDMCDVCGECEQNCPVGAITLDPTPSFGEACFDCCNCIRLCPKNAIIPAVPLAAIQKMIHERVKTIDEQPRSQLFLADATGGF